MAGTRLAVQVYFFVTILLLGLPLAAWFEFVPRGSRLPPPEAIAAAIAAANATLATFSTLATLTVHGDLAACEAPVAASLRRLRHVR